MAGDFVQTTKRVFDKKTGRLLYGEGEMVPVDEAKRLGITGATEKTKEESASPRSAASKAAVTEDRRVTSFKDHDAAVKALHDEVKATDQQTAAAAETDTDNTVTTAKASGRKVRSTRAETIKK